MRCRACSSFMAIPLFASLSSCRLRIMPPLNHRDRTRDGAYLITSRSHRPNKLGRICTVVIGPRSVPAGLLTDVTRLPSGRHRLVRETESQKQKQTAWFPLRGNRRHADSQVWAAAHLNGLWPFARSPRRVRTLGHADDGARSKMAMRCGAVLQRCKGRMARYSQFQRGVVRRALQVMKGKGRR